MILGLGFSGYVKQNKTKNQMKLVIHYWIMAIVEKLRLKGPN